MSRIQLIVSMIHELKRLGCDKRVIRQVFRQLYAYNPELRKNVIKHFAFNNYR